MTKQGKDNKKVDEVFLQDVFSSNDLTPLHAVGNMAEASYTYNQHSAAPPNYKDPIIILNLNGKRFEVDRQTFCRVEPQLVTMGAVQCGYATRVSHLPQHLQPSVPGDTTSGNMVEYFVPRHGPSFVYILDYFQHEELHLPTDICPTLFSRELRHWGVDPSGMSVCCRRKYISFFDDQETLRDFDKSFAQRDSQRSSVSIVDGKHPSTWSQIRRKGWAIFNDPSFSIWSKVYIVMATAFVLLSIFVLIASTEPTFRRGLTNEEWKEYLGDDYDDIAEKLGWKEPKESNEGRGGGWDSEEDDTTTSPPPNRGKRHAIPDYDVVDEPQFFSIDMDTYQTSKKTVWQNILDNGDLSPGKINLVKKLKKSSIVVRKLDAREGKQFDHKTNRQMPETYTVSPFTENQIVGTEFDDDNDRRDRPERNSIESEALRRSRRAVTVVNGTLTNVSITQNITALDEEGTYIISGEELAILIGLIYDAGIEQGQGDSTTDLPEGTFSNYLWLTNIDRICIVFFTIEFLLRLLFAPNRCMYLINFFTVVDALSLICMYAVMIIHQYDERSKYQTSYVEMINCLQLVRVFRFFRLVKDITGFRVLVFSVKSSWRELMLLFIYLVMAVVIFASLAYYSERGNMGSIPRAAWWAVVTMTTVGYGDIVPKSAVGRLVGTACAVSGVLLIAVTVPVFVNNFLLFYEHSKIIDRKDNVEDDADAEKASSTKASPNRGGGGGGNEDNSTNSEGKWRLSEESAATSSVSRCSSVCGSFGQSKRGSSSGDGSSPPPVSIPENVSTMNSKPGRVQSSVSRASDISLTKVKPLV